MKGARTLATVYILAAGLAATNAHADWIYATVDYSGDLHLIQIDVATGDTTDVGICTVASQPGHEPGLTGLSWHTDGRLYAFDTYGNQVITLDTTTAVGTLVTPVGADLGGWMFGLAIEPNGDYYVTGQELRQGTLPGATSQVGPVDYGDTDSCDLAPNGTLYGTDELLLVTIDKTTNARSIVRTWSDVSIAGIAIDGSFAWAIDNGDVAPGNQWLVTTDLGTGDLTYLHELPNGYYLATALPEPASLSLVALGGLALLRGPRRKA